ncbi:MAG: hypothetical protein ACLGI6_17520 [Gammaproteobacteria bacterium]
MTKSILISAAATSLLVALLHVYVIANGAPAYRRFGAGETLASMAEQGSWLPALLTAGITAVFMLFAAYYLSGAGLLPQLPFLRIGMIGIAAIYTLRGAMVALALHQTMSPFDFYSSLVSLLVGLLHLAGLWLAWPALAAGAPAQ